jgi:hypothetical protein
MNHIGIPHVDFRADGLGFLTRQLAIEALVVVVDEKYRTST